MLTLQYYINRREYYRRSINSQRAAVARYNNELSRLENAYSKLKSIKNNYSKQLIDDVKPKNLSEGFKWRGKYKNDYDAEVEGDCKRSAKNFNDDIDRMMEIVNRAIRDKKNQRDSANGSINGLTVTFNNICYIIRNWVD